MKLALAYLGVVLVWTTTPLAIKWSSLGLSFVAGVASRMSIGLLCLVLIMLLSRTRLRLDRAALLTYGAVSVQLYLSMLLTYWGAQFVPSGWMSVIYGLSPFMTAFMAAAWLDEPSLSPGKLVSYLLGLAGLMVMFRSAIDIDLQAVKGMLALVAATFLHAISAVWVKRIDARLSALTQITGGLSVSVPLYLISWWYWDAGQWPELPPANTQYAILYLGLIATPIGFMLYYYVLARMAATTVAMINLMTPVLSLLLGFYLNQEPITTRVMIGTGLIMLALALHNVFSKRPGKARA